MNKVMQWMSLATHRVNRLPILILMPHSRCNCRCVMCDIWKSNHEKKELSVEVLSKQVKSLQQFGVREVALSGGEALMHTNLWKLCELLQSVGIKITLLSTGLSVKTHAEEIIRHCQQVIVSLDGSRDIHNIIRNIPGAFEKLEEGVKTLKRLRPGFRVTGRCVVQRANFHDFHNIIDAAHEIGLDQISFLPADVSSTAFNRATGWGEDKKKEIALTIEETDELENILRKSIADRARDYRQHFIAEAPTRIMEMAQYFRAMHGTSSFAKKKCNAPWVSAVVESNGDVLPCFFHPPYGNISEGPFEKIINGPKAVSFRKQLNVNENDICQKCVCSLYRNPWRLL